MRRIETAAERVQAKAWARGDYRTRCDQAHLICRGCGVCACYNGQLDSVEYPTGRVRVSTDKHGDTICRECRYQDEHFG